MTTATPETLAAGDTLTVDGIQYVILTAQVHNFKGEERVSYTVRRPKGRVEYYVVRYGNGQYSKVV